MGKCKDLAKLSVTKKCLSGYKNCEMHNVRKASSI